ncbi:MAG: HAD-IIIC family phosphatase [Clostridia bacterium]|nr:HAD-IIIC family phosphatase [Clostridia bacterium]
MYQFYYADRSVPLNRGECKLNIRDRFQITAVRPAMWEEHCLECAAPTCFESCVHYQARSDGRCKRFTNGLYTFADEKACCGQGVRVKFRKWGNMMTVLFPAMLTEEDYRKLWKKNEETGKLLHAVESSKLPRSLRWQGIRIPEYLRRRNLRKLAGLDNTADAFLFHAYSYNEENYRLIVEIYNDHTPVYKTAVSVDPGENMAVVGNLPPECSMANNLVKVYPENNLEAELDILWCDFVQGEPVVNEQPAPQVKCVVWDLDNTLWSGTLIETENSDMLELKPGIRELMEKLDERGIIQSVASKNEYDAAMAVLVKLGAADYFLYPQIHWNPKSGSIKAIAESLNIGIDTFAFIDDTAFEREEVRSTYPQVRVYDVTEIASLLPRPEFDVPVTAESKNRRAMYRAEEKRNSLMKAGQTDIVEFLKKCNLRIHLFEPITEEEKLRCYELIVRTNQLNMTGRKHTAEEFANVLNRPEHRNFTFSCADDFGEYGIVGFGQYRVENKTLMFTEFAMSCRVAGKFVESALFAELLRRESCTDGHFDVVKTKKNVLLRQTLEEIGFAVIGESAELMAYRFNSSLIHHEIVKID